MDAITIFFGLIVAAVGFALFSFIILDRKRAAWILCPLLFASCLGIAEESNGRLVMGLFYPLQLYRSELFLVFGAALGLHTLVHFKWVQGRSLSIQAFVLTAIGFYAALLRFVHEGGGAGLASVLYASGTLLPLLFVSPILVREFSDPARIFRACALVNAAWIGCVMVQILADPSKVVMGRDERFIGLLGNPQHAGSLMAVFIAISLYLFMNDPLRRYKLIWLGLVGVDVVLLGWTGSRTGLGMAVLGVTGVLYARFGKAILWLPAFAILAAIAFELFQALGLTIGFERLASTENTRGTAWADLLRSGLSSPVVGVGIQNTDKSENGYLYGFAAYGAGMVLLIILLIATTAFTSLRLLARRKYLSPGFRSLSDFMIGYFALYFGGSVFEGYMMARVAANLTFFMLFAGIASQLIQITNEALAAEASQEDEPTYEADDDLYLDTGGPYPAT